MAAEIDVLWIGEPFPGCMVGKRLDLPSAIAWLQAQPHSPELIVVAQQRPGEVSPEQIERLRGQAPLARIVGLLGSWCEGEARSGRPWPGVERVYWHQWPGWRKRELHRRSSVPQTASMEERLLAESDAPIADREISRGVVVICSQNREAAQLWLDTLHQRQYSAVLLDMPPRQTLGVAAALWDSDDCNAAELGELRQLVMAVRPAPVVAVLGFPRLEARERVMAAGAAAVLSKPLMLADLWASLPGAAAD